MLTFTLSKEEVEGLKSDNKVTIIFAHSRNLDSITELWRGLEGHKKGTANLECVCSVPQLCPMISWAVACPLCPWWFSRQQYWNGLPCLSPRDILNPGIELRSPTLQEDSLPSESPGQPKLKTVNGKWEMTSCFSYSWIISSSSKFNNVAKYISHLN